MNTKNLSLENLKSVVRNNEGRVGPPILLWLLGVPGSICVVLWLAFWRG